MNTKKARGFCMYKTLNSYIERANKNLAPNCQILSLGDNATQKDLERARRWLLLSFHPDKFKIDDAIKGAENSTKEINSAYDEAIASLEGRVQTEEREQAR